MRRGEPFPRDPRPSSVLTRRQALLITMAGLLTAGQWLPLRADAVVPATATAAAKPKSVQVSTCAGAGDKDGRDWQNAMPIGALNRVLASARPGAPTRSGAGACWRGSMPSGRRAGPASACA